VSGAEEAKMQHQITARHCEVPDELRERAVAVLERLGAQANRPVDGTALFDVDGVSRTVELRMHVSRGDLFVASGEADDHRTALDRAEDKMRRQIEKAFGNPRSARKSMPSIEV
jgi:ribosome-associated translation inhibitor RaiA